MSVLCKAGDFGKLRQICNRGYSRVNMFSKTLPKAYVHIKDIKRQRIGILFFSKQLFSHIIYNVSYHFPIWKNNKGSKFSESFECAPFF